MPDASAPRVFPWFLTFLVIFATLIAAVISLSVSGGGADPWYAALNKPRLHPPEVAFAFLWPAQYALMALGAILVCRAARSFNRASEALGLFFTQLGVHAVWSVFFFSYQQPLVALGTLAALWLLIIAMIRVFAKHSTLAALIQLPYLAWNTFAGYLNAFIVRLD
jgi:tryptophan-rich sensory protein